MEAAWQTDEVDKTRVMSGCGASAHHQLSKQYLDTLPVEARVQAVLARGDAHVLTWAKLRRICPHAPEPALLAAVVSCAVLVQGCWVASSALRCGGDPAAEAARDAALLLLARRRTVPAAAVATAAGAHLPLWRELLRPLAVHHQSNGEYEFREPTDAHFIKAHPKLVASQVRGSRCYLFEKVAG